MTIDSVRKIMFLAIAILISIEVNAQCPSNTVNSNTTITASCTVTGDLTITNGATLTVNSGVILTVTGTLTVRSVSTLNATGATINVGANLRETSGSLNTINGGIFTVGGNFTTGSGGDFTMDGSTVTVTGNTELEGSNITINNSTISTSSLSSNLSSLTMDNIDITTTGTMDIEDASISNSTLSAGGELIFNTGTITLDNTTVESGTSYGVGTGVAGMTINGGATLNLSSGTQMDITGDVANNNGGGFFIDASDVVISGNFDNFLGGELSVTNNGSIRIGGNFDNTSGDTSASSGGTIVVDGNYDNTTGNTNIVGGGLLVGGTYTGSAPTGDGGDCSSGGGGCCGTACSTLPVELIYFSLTPQEDKILAQWATATETNNDYFTVERSQDGRSFDKIAQIDGQGTTDERQEYHYVDQINMSGIVYYRLSQTDFDGTTALFDVKAAYINPGKSSIDVVVYPSSVKPGKPLQVSSPYSVIEEYNIQLFDMSGKKYQLDSRKSDNTINLSPLPTILNPGMYTLQIMINQKLYTRKVIIE